MQFNEPNPLAASRLGIAARVGDENIVLNLLNKGSRVDIRDNRGWNALHEAAAANHIGCLKLLLEKGKEYVNEKTLEGETPLLLACLHERGVDLISVLLENGSVVNFGNNENFTPLHQACSSGDFDVAKLLIEAGANIDDQNLDLWTPLHFAVSSKNADIMKYLMSKGANIRIQDDNGRTPLFLACESCNLDIVKPLIELYGFVDIRTNDGTSPLMMASQCGSLEVVQELLKQGANPNLVADDHTMAIHLAVHSGCLSVVQLLLKVTNKEVILETCKHPEIRRNSSLCCLAVDCESLEVLELLVTSDLGNDILHLPIYPYFDEVNDMQLQYVFTYNCESCISFLLKSKLPDLKDKAIDFLKLLLKHGFPVNSTYPHCLPPLVALSFQDEERIAGECVDLLIAHGADINFTTQSFEAPDALLAASLTGKRSLMLKLFSVGSSGLPNDLLRCLLLKTLLHRNWVVFELMVDCLLKLGVTESDLFVQLRLFRLFSSCGKLLKITTLKPLAEYRMCTLQQLSRIAVRKLLRQPFSSSLNQLAVPKCVKDYILYK